MAELKNYVEGQPIEPSRPIIYTTIEEQAELNAYREFGSLPQLRVLCDNYHELLNELRSRATEAEIRASAIDRFLTEMLNEFDSRNADIEEHTGSYVVSRLHEIAEQLKEEQ